MEKIGKHSGFLGALWAGLAAPVAVFEAPAAYPVYTNTMADSFSRVGGHITEALGTTAGRQDLHDDQN